MSDLKGQQIRDAYDQLLTKGSGNTVEDGDGNPFDIFNRAFTAGGLVRLPSGLNFNASGGDTLSDYEVGTWTPVDNSGAGLTLDFSVAGFARYVRIGKIVFFATRFDYPSTASTANSEIAGLPFSATSAQNYGLGAISSQPNVVYGFVIENRVIFHSATSLTNASIRNVDISGERLFINGFYFIS